MLSNYTSNFVSSSNSNKSFFYLEKVAKAETAANCHFSCFGGRKNFKTVAADRVKEAERRGKEKKEQKNSCGWQCERVA